MQFIRIFSLFFILILPLVSSAETIYKHRLPFMVTLKEQDTLQVTYDFTQKKGIRCIANHPIKATFEYRGRQKVTTLLPLILQSDHIPANKYEHLADVEGRLLLSVEKPSAMNKTLEIACDFQRTANAE